MRITSLCVCVLGVCVKQVFPKQSVKEEVASTIRLRSEDVFIRDVKALRRQDTFTQFIFFYFCSCAGRTNKNTESVNQ